jgi:H+/Cl- antiporter ClcA
MAPVFALIIVNITTLFVNGLMNLVRYCQDLRLLGDEFTRQHGLNLSYAVTGIIITPLAFAFLALFLVRCLKRNNKSRRNVLASAIILWSTIVVGIVTNVVLMCVFGTEVNFAIDSFFAMVLLLSLIGVLSSFIMTFAYVVRRQALNLERDKAAAAALAAEEEANRIIDAEKAALKKLIEEK